MIYSMETKKLKNSLKQREQEKWEGDVGNNIFRFIYQPSRAKIYLGNGDLTKWLL